MEKRKPWTRIAGLILSGLIIILAGCGTVSTHPSKARKFAEEAAIKLSLGDTRQEVRTLLGKPLIDAKDHNLEVYRFSGRDTDIDFVLIYPFPVPSPYKVIASAVILYDEEDKIKDMAVDAMTDGYHYAEANQLQFCSFRISAGGYRFVNSPALGCAEPPETLIGPPISWDELSNNRVPEGECSLVLLMNECPMEIVSLDNRQIVDFSPAGSECVGGSEYLGTFIQKDISSGAHRLAVSQRTRVQSRDFKTDFVCEDGETIYAELDVDVVDEPTYVFGVRWGRKIIIDGELSVSNSPPKGDKLYRNHNGNITSESVLSPILWHKGEWYGE